VAVHSNVSEDGFTDRQELGLMKRWEHTHRFTSLSDDLTRIDEFIEYEHHNDIRGLFSRILFSHPALWMLFTYRKLVTRKALARTATDATQTQQSSV
jgi:ligand-binding SRPBCC domain-containing protein